MGWDDRENFSLSLPPGLPNGIVKDKIVQHACKQKRQNSAFHLRDGLLYDRGPHGTKQMNEPHTPPVLAVALANDTSTSNVSPEHGKAWQGSK